MKPVKIGQQQKHKFNTIQPSQEKLEGSSDSIDLEQEVKWQEENGDTDEGEEYTAEMDSLDSKNNYGAEEDSQI